MEYKIKKHTQKKKKKYMLEKIFQQFLKTTPFWKSGQRGGTMLSFKISQLDISL